MTQPTGQLTAGSPLEIAWSRAYDIAGLKTIDDNTLEEFQALLRKIPDLNMTPETLTTTVCPLLHRAAARGSLSALTSLLEAGADINHRYEFNAIPLRNALRTGIFENVELLVLYGSNVNSEDFVGFPLMHAAYSGVPAVVEFMLSQNVMISQPEVFEMAISKLQEVEGKQAVSSARVSAGESSQQQAPRSIHPGRASMSLDGSLQTINGTAPILNSPSPQAGSGFGPNSNVASAQRINKLEQRIQVILLLLKYNLKPPNWGKSDSYLMTHPRIKDELIKIAQASLAFSKKLQHNEFQNVVNLSLIGECIDDEKAKLIASTLLSPSSSSSSSKSIKSNVLKRLDLSRNWIEQKGAAAIGSALGKNTTLETLILAHNLIHDVSQMISGMKDNRTLQHLDLSDNLLTTISAEAIAPQLAHLRLTSLNLSLNKLEHQGAMQILRAVILAPGSDLAPSISPSVAAFGSKSTVDTREAVTSSSSNSTPKKAYITSLNLCCNSITPLESDMIRADLVAGLAKNRYLTHLDLSFNWYPRGEILRLIGALSNNVTLTSLHLKGYCWDEPSLASMATSLSLNHSLSEFQFTHHPRSEAADVIRRHVHKNSTAFSNSHFIQDIPSTGDEDCDTPTNPSQTPTTQTPPPQDLRQTLPPLQHHNSTSSAPTAHDNIFGNLPHATTHDGHHALAISASATLSHGHSSLDSMSHPSMHKSPSAPLSGYASFARSFTNALAQSAADLCPPDRKQFGIVRKGEYEADLTSYKYIPGFSMDKLPPVHVETITEIHSAHRNFQCFPKCTLEYTHINKLILQRNNLTSLPRAIARLVNLIILDVRSNFLPMLPPEIGSLPRLMYLLASQNRMEGLPMQLADAPALERVALWDNPLTMLPQNYRNTLQDLFGKPFKESQLYQFLKEMTKTGETRFNRARLMLVGEPAVGKSTLRRLLVTGKAQLSTFASMFGRSKPILSVATDGIDIEAAQFKSNDGRNYCWDVWDYAGHEVYKTTHTLFLSSRAIYILLFNMQEFSRASIEYWMQSIRFKAKDKQDAPMFLVGTHPDKISSSERKRILQEIESFYHGYFKMVTWINPETGENIMDLKQKIYEVAVERNYVDEIIPTSYLTVTEQLSKINGTKPYLPLKELTGLLLSNSVSKEGIDAAMSWLLDTGTVLLYGSSTNPEQLVFINPQFLCNTFSQAVSIKHNFSLAGKLSKAVIAGICNNDANFQREFIRILRSFDLAFVLQRNQEAFSSEDHLNALRGGVGVSTEEDFDLFVPALLSSTEPANLGNIWKVDHSKPLFQRWFTFNFLPLGFFSKTIVRCLLLPDLKSKCYWANGIVGEMGDSIFLTVFDPEMNILKLQVNGGKDGKILAKLVEVVTGIVKEWYPEAKYSTTIPVIVNGNETLFLDADEIQSNAVLGAYVHVADGRIFDIATLAPDFIFKDLERLRVNYEDVEVGQQLGEPGSFGTVYAAKYRGENLALKKLHRFESLPNDELFYQIRANLFADFAHELRLMSLFHHPNIVALKGFIPTPLSILMEEIHAGALHSRLAKHGSEMSWPLRVRIALDIALGMQYLHRHEPPLCHRDLRSPNVLLDSVNPEDPKAVAKVADFGLTQPVVDRLGYEPGESWRWCAPEILTNNPHTHRSDIYSFGAILMELIYGVDPFYHLQKKMNLNEAQIRSMVTKMELFPEFPTDYTTLAISPKNEQEHEALKQLSILGSECCNPKPQLRPSFKDIVPRLLNIIKEMGTISLPESVLKTCDPNYLMEDLVTGDHRKPEDVEEDEDENSQPHQASSSSSPKPDSINLSLFTGFRLADDVDIILESYSNIVPQSLESSSPIPSSQQSGSPVLCDSPSATTRNNSSAATRTPIASTPAEKIVSRVTVTASLVVADQLWLGFSNGKIGIWDLSPIRDYIKSAQQPSSFGTIHCPSSATTQIKVHFLKAVGEHVLAIRGLALNDQRNQVCAISEDGYFSMYDPNRNFRHNKFQPLPNEKPPWISMCSSGGRIYMGSAKGHVVCYSWESPPKLLTYWIGIDKLPCCQLIHFTGSKDLCVVYGDTIKFLGMIDLVDSLRHWSPHVKAMISASSLRVPTTAEATMQTSTASMRRGAHDHLAHSTPGNNHAQSFEYITECKNAASLIQVGKRIWSKNNEVVRVWKSHTKASENVITTTVADPISPSKTKQVKVIAKSQSYDEAISLIKQLSVPSSDFAPATPFASIMLSFGSNVVILNSPRDITLWKGHPASMLLTLPLPSASQPRQIPPLMELIFMYSSSLVAVSNGKLHLWHGIYQSTTTKEATPTTPVDASVPVVTSALAEISAAVPASEATPASNNTV